MASRTHDAGQGRGEAAGRPAARRGAQSLSRATGLLALVANRHPAGITLRDLVAESGLDRTTTHRMLMTLVDTGLLEREAEAPIYRLGLEAMLLGMAALERSPLLARCEAAMKSIARRTGEHVFLVVRAGDYSHCLHMEQGRRPIRTFGDQVGGARLLGLGMPSFAMLARFDEPGVAAHFARHREQYEAHGLSAARLLRWTRQAREVGYTHITAQGLSGVALWFRAGRHGDAAMGVVAPAARIPRSRGATVAALLAEELRRLPSG